MIACIEPPALLRWLVHNLAAGCAIHEWLKTQTLPFPDEPERTCDTVAGLFETGPPPVWWALVIEAQTKPDSEMFGRLLEYLAQLWRTH